MFRADLPEPRYGVGTESLEVELVEPAAIPWDEIAFPSVRFALERYLGDRRAARGLHFHAIDLRRPGGCRRSFRAFSTTAADRVACGTIRPSFAAPEPGLRQQDRDDQR